jgi:hypothetical protein
MGNSMFFLYSVYAIIAKNANFKLNNSEKSSALTC